MGKLPKRILFYRGQWFSFCLARISTDAWPTDGVSEGEFEAILNEELPLIRSTSSFRVAAAFLTP